MCISRLLELLNNRLGRLKYAFRFPQITKRAWKHMFQSFLHHFPFPQFLSTQIKVKCIISANSTPKSWKKKKGMSTIQTKSPPETLITRSRLIKQQQGTVSSRRDDLGAIRDRTRDESESTRARLAMNSGSEKERVKKYLRSRSARERGKGIWFWVNKRVLFLCALNREKGKRRESKSVTRK
jgi:hypothetical protein